MQVASENLTFYAGDLVLDQFVATDELRMPILNKLPSSVFRVLTMKLGMRVPRRTYGRTWPDQPSRGPIGRMRVGQLFDSIDAEHNTETEVSSEGVDLMRIGLGNVITDSFTVFSARSNAIVVRKLQPRIE